MSADAERAVRIAATLLEEMGWCPEEELTDAAYCSDTGRNCRDCIIKALRRRIRGE